MAAAIAAYIACQVVERDGYIKQRAYLPIDDGMFSIHNDLSRCRNHEGGH